MKQKTWGEHRHGVSIHNARLQVRCEQNEYKNGLMKGVKTPEQNDFCEYVGESGRGRKRGKTETQHEKKI